MTRLYIFDVDGTLGSPKSGGDFRQTADDWELYPGILERCEQLVSQSKLIALATNQGGVAFPWSKFTEQEIQAELSRLALEIGASLVSICFNSANEKALPQYFHKNDPRRKPNPGMLLEIIEAAQISKEETLYVGDRPEDEQAAQNAGVAFQWAHVFFS